ncbi:MAG: ATP-binding protein [Bacteroidota bacterium]
MIRKLTPLLCYLVFAALFSASAQNEVDSLKLLLRNQEKDTSRVSTYIQLYEALKFEDPGQASNFLTKSLKLSSDLEYQKGKLRSLLLIGEEQRTYSNYDSALLVFQQAQSIAEQLDERKGVMNAMIGQGFSYSSLQRLNEADTIAFLTIKLARSKTIDSLILTNCYTILSNTAFYRSEYEKSIEFDQKGLIYNTSNLSKRAKSLLNIGTTHAILRNEDKAYEYYIKALETSEEAEDIKMTALVHLELGAWYMYDEDYSSAQKYYNLAMANFELVGDKARQAHIHHNLSKIHMALNEYNDAIKKSKLALQIIQEVNSPYSEGHFLYQLGLAYFKTEEYNKAQDNFLKAQILFEEIESGNMKRWILFRLSECYAAQGDYQNAFTYLQKVKRIDDSTFSIDKTNNIAEIEEKYQSEQKQKEIELLNAENQIATLEIQKQHDFRNYLIVAAFLLVVLIGVIYNRYQLKTRANAKLTELDHLKTNFFTNISHEFRTPLTLILSPLQKLLKQEDSLKKKEALTIIHRNATILTELTNQLLDLSKLEAGELHLKATKGEFSAFIRVVCASFESLASAQNVEFIKHINNAPEEAYFDEDKVQKILNNLLSNAFKFTSTEGTVSLRIEQKNNLLCISVTDTGKGISTADQELIFKRFHQNKDNASSAAGTGVGLTLSKELALLHKGDITVESEPGQGATFTLEFPINKSAYLPKEIVEGESQTYQTMTKITSIPADQEAAEQEASEKIVLIVEDNPDLRNHMTSLLESDFTVKQSIDGKVGIENALKLVPDIIVTDLMMPEVDGIELCNTLKANEKTSHIPIIMLTAKADRDTKLDGLKKGADDFLTKPFDNEELLIRIQNLITQREKLQTKYGQTLRLEPSKITIDSPEEVFIKKALEIVDRNLSNSEFTVEAFQKEIGMSRMQLHRKLKALTNFSASEFIKDIRLQRAADLLATNGINVAEVAYGCGFNSVSYFTKCFTEKYGANPSNYLVKVS